MYKKALRLTACGLASALLITGSNTTTYAAPVAGVTSAMEVGASNDTLVAGFSLTFIIWSKLSFFLGIHRENRAFFYPESLFFGKKSISIPHFLLFL